MKRQWTNFVKDYLTFTRKERIGLSICLALIIAFATGYKYFIRQSPPVDVAAFQQELAALKITIDSSRQFTARKYDNDFDNEGGHYTPSSNYKKDDVVKGELFAFDPNTLDAAGWKRLGVRDKTIETIGKFVSKGYTFRKAEDIKKIYGLRPAEAERLIPYVQIAAKEQAIAASFTSSKNETPFAEKPVVARPPRVMDINNADTTALIALPGIGSKLAARIINFREKLGGFTSVKQIAETYALPDSTFQKIKDRMTCNDPVLKTIDINKADVNQLKSHPYFRWNIANAIVAYRQQHGLYKSVNDLKKIDIITEELFEKISPYLAVSK